MSFSSEVDGPRDEHALGVGRGSLQLQVLRTRRVHLVRTGHYGERVVVVVELSPLVQGRGGQSSTAAWRGADVSTVHKQHGGNEKNIYISGEEKKKQKTADRGGLCEVLKTRRRQKKDPGQ